MASPRTSVVVWEWEDFPNVWLPYEVEAAHFIEGNFQSHKENVINLGQVHFRLACYELNLKNMTQTRIETGMLKKKLKITSATTLGDYAREYFWRSIRSLPPHPSPPIHLG